MSINQDAYKTISDKLQGKATLVAVSKTKPASDILALYQQGHRDFGENYVQELTEKYSTLPKDIRWHFIGHLQRNKVKYIAPFVHLIHGVDSFDLLKEINKQALKQNRVIDCLLQVHIARGETKFGLDENELAAILSGGATEVSGLKNVRVCGLMGMASFSDDQALIRTEFRYLKQLFDIYFSPGNSQPPTTSHLLATPTLSMGMSSDYTIAIEEGSNMVRIGSLLFGARH